MAVDGRIRVIVWQFVCASIVYRASGNQDVCHFCTFLLRLKKSLYFYLILFGYILHEIRKRKTSWIGHILRRNCLLKQVIEGKIKGEMEVARRRGRRRKKLLDVLKDRRGYSHLKEEALDRSIWRHRFGGGFGPVVRQNTE